MKNITYLLFIFLITFNSCADWETTTERITSGTIVSNRVVLVEEFTGASCPACPAGTVELENILSKYPDNVAVIGVHSRFLGDPVKPTDPKLVTTDANSIETFMGFYLGKPEAAINRTHFEGQQNIRIGKPDSWITFVEDELKKQATASLSLVHSIDDATRELKINVTVTALEDMNFPIHLHVALTESDIITAQKHNTGIYDTYTQNHVLRKLLTPVIGDPISSGLLKNSNISKQFTFVVPTDPVLWNLDNCHIVAFISKNETEKIVLQAIEKDIK